MGRFPYLSSRYSSGEQADAETESTRSDRHAPLRVMGDHPYGKSEWMLSYRFMAIGMDGLRDGKERITAVTKESLHKFAICPMCMVGAMFAPHEHLTLMPMTG